jgi:hypothetical protein
LAGGELQNHWIVGLHLLTYGEVARECVKMLGWPSTVTLSVRIVAHALYMDAADMALLEDLGGPEIRIPGLDALLSLW